MSDLDERLRDAYITCETHFVLDYRSFKHGYLAALPRWIPVSERLPEFEFKAAGDEFVYVLAVGALQPGEYIYSKKLGWQKTDWDREDKYEFKITHWMPLPEPLKDETGKEQSDDE